LRLATFRRQDISIHERTTALPSPSHVVLEQPCFLRTAGVATIKTETTRLDVQQLAPGVDTHIGRIDVVSSVSGDLVRTVREEADTYSSTWYRCSAYMDASAISKREAVISCAGRWRDAWPESDRDALCSGVLLDDCTFPHRMGTATHSKGENERHWTAISHLHFQGSGDEYTVGCRWSNRAYASPTRTAGAQSDRALTRVGTFVSNPIQWSRRA
jgi:hypothetical protein